MASHYIMVNTMAWRRIDDNHYLSQCWLDSPGGYELSHNLWHWINYHNRSLSLAIDRLAWCSATSAFQRFYWICSSGLSAWFYPRDYIYSAVVVIFFPKEKRKGNKYCACSISNQIRYSVVLWKSNCHHCYLRNLTKLQLAMVLNSGPD